MTDYTLTITGPDPEPCDDETARAEAKRANDRLDALPTVTPATPYDDTLIVAAQAALEARVGALEGKPDDDTDDTGRGLLAALAARVDSLEQRPTGTGSGSSVRLSIDSLGADDTARFTALVAKYRAGWKGEVEFAARWYKCPIQIPTFAAIRWVGTGTPSREYGTGTVIEYTGPAGTSLFLLQTNTGYSYPSGGNSRDCGFTGIEWRAGNDRDFLPPAPSATFNGAYVQWYWNFHNCGWNGWKRIAYGWGDGFSVTGATHWQASAQTPFKMGGAENHIFGDGSLADSNNATWMAADQPFVDWSCDKSILGAVMLSARLKSYQLKVTYGHNSRAIGTMFDAPDSAPTESYQVRYIGSAVNFHHIGNSFKGGQGILCQSGATEVAVDSCAFHNNRGLARCEAAFTGVLLWGLTNTYGNCPKVIYAARGNQVINGDPRVSVKSLDGTLTGIRNPDGTYTTAKNAAGATVAF